jgi:hypothetical protein
MRYTPLIASTLPSDRRKVVRQRPPGLVSRA